MRMLCNALLRGMVEAARAIEPLCILWCISGKRCVCTVFRVYLSCCLSNADSQVSSEVTGPTP